MVLSSSVYQQGGKKLLQQLQEQGCHRHRRVFVCHPPTTSAGGRCSSINSMRRFAHSSHGANREYTSKSFASELQNHHRRTNHQHISLVSPACWFLTPLGSQSIVSQSFIYILRRSMSTNNSKDISESSDSSASKASETTVAKLDSAHSNVSESSQLSTETKQQLQKQQEQAHAAAALSAILAANANSKSINTQPGINNVTPGLSPDSHHKPHLADYVSSVANKAHSIGDTVHKGVDVLYHQWYERMEETMMHTVNESNRRRFRIYFFGSIALMIITTYVFGDDIRKAVSAQTADIAKETLENESLKIQTQELAMAVVQTVLNDKEITAHAATFLKEASSAEETQQALLALTLHVLQHPECLEELTRLSKKLITELSNDPEVMNCLSDLIIRLSQDPVVKEALAKMVIEVLNDPEVMREATKAALVLIARPEITKATTDLLQKSSAEVLEDEEIIQQSRIFIADVVGDELLHKEGGNALWKTVYYALKPGVVRIGGLGLVVASAAAIRLFMSPF